MSSGPVSPSVATIKRLFAVSGNKCAFPGCKATLVDTPSGKVTGRICHIKAQSHGGKRYDSNQTNAERHGFYNLILLCNAHHDVIDSDDVTYTVESLQQMKREHESKHQDGYEPSDDIAQKLISNNAIHVQNGSAIFTVNQMGGQVAHQIINYGPQQRKIDRYAAEYIISELKKLAPETVELTVLMGDGEAFNFASNIKQVLESAGWKVNGIDQALYSVVPKGVILKCPQQRPSFVALGNWLVRIGVSTIGELIPGQTFSIIVGSNMP